MAGHEAELTRFLRDRGELPAGAKIVAAWSGQLVELRGTQHDDAASSQPAAIFGISGRTGHLLSRFGVLSFDLSHVRGPHSPRLQRLRFSVVREPAARIDICMKVESAHAIASQLSDWKPPSVGTLRATRRSPAKSRIDPLEKARQLAIRLV